mmetsp:Transcript_121786/g.345196  ORF Transcript_121786/g.345196 Transcript_121786/m.345196 type:complete len:207 (-) Transcript_121786:159-779(-)
MSALAAVSKSVFVSSSACAPSPRASWAGCGASAHASTLSPLPCSWLTSHSGSSQILIQSSSAALRPTGLILGGSSSSSPSRLISGSSGSPPGVDAAPPSPSLRPAVSGSGLRSGLSKGAQAGARDGGDIISIEAPPPCGERKEKRPLSCWMIDPSRLVMRADSSLSLFGESRKVSSPMLARHRARHGEGMLRTLKRRPPSRPVLPL